MQEFSIRFVMLGFCDDWNKYDCNYVNYIILILFNLYNWIIIISTNLRILT